MGAARKLRLLLAKLPQPRTVQHVGVTSALSSLQQQSGRRSGQALRGESANDKIVVLHEAFDDCQHRDNGLAKPLLLVHLEPLHHGAGGRQHGVGVRGGAGRVPGAGECDVRTRPDAHEDEVRTCGGVARVASQVVVLVLPEGMGLKQRLRQHAVEQPRGRVGLDAPLARDDCRECEARVEHGVRVARAVALPLGPQVGAMAIRRLHVAQAEARVGGVLDRAVEAPAVALDTVNVHDAARAVDEDLAPHARMLGLLADEVGDLRVLGE
eukprot:1736286-Pleurochrysis_carterae.AAC.3